MLDMAKKPIHGEGKHPIQPLRGTDGRFLLQGTDPPDLLSVVAEETPFPPNDDDDSPPVTSRGLVMLEPTSRVELNIATPPLDETRCASGETEWSTPPCILLLPQLVSSRSWSEFILVTTLPNTPVPHAPPVTVKTDSDKSGHSWCRTHRVLALAAPNSSRHHGMGSNRVDTHSSHYREAQFEPEVPPGSVMGTNGKDEAVIAVELLNSCVCIARSRFCCVTISR